MEGIFIFEALLVLAILGYQFFVYRNNKVKIEQIKNLFPSEDQLSVTETLLDHTAPIVATTTQTTDQLWAALLAGKPFREFTPSNPAVKRIVSVENDLLHIEAKGGPVPAYTIAREKFDKLVTGHNIYLVQGDPDALVSSVSSGGKGAATIDLIEVRNPSETFSKIIKNTNEYLKRNKGAAADFDILKDVSERYSEALDAEVQSTVTTPLYIGLLGTFSGVIIGLSSLIWSGFTADEGNAAGSFITDQNIPSFLFGVMIAMAGSFCGLLLTLMGNHDLKNARSMRDRRQNDYYTFLQTHLLPKLNSDMAASLSNLKSVLDSFNKDFLDKVLGFRPIVDTLTENISTQKEFIEKLDKIGFTQMANANLQVFDKMKESEQLFKNFMQYQVALNESVQKGAELTYTISDVLGRLTSLQEGFDKVPGYLQKHDESIQRQVNFFGQHERELHDIGSRIEQYFDKAALRLTDLMEARLQHQERDAQNAYEKWQEHFRNLNEDNVYQRILDYMQPFENLNLQQERLNNTQQQLSGEIQQTNERLLQKIETDTAIQQQLLQQMQVLNVHMARSLEPGPLKAALGKIFGGGNSRR